LDENEWSRFQKKLMGNFQKLLGIPVHLLLAVAKQTTKRKTILGVHSQQQNSTVE
jgi:hypothetical protein